VNAPPAGHRDAPDDEEILALLEEVMLAAGYAVTTVTSGSALLSRFAEAPFDAVVTDMRMPHGDGLAVIDGIRALDAHTPIVVITGYSDHDEATLRARGANVCLRKPLRHLDDLPDAVTALLRPPTP
jgi:CheY-like chemotaxis protein